MWLDALDVLRRGAFQLFLQSHTPLPLQFRKFAGEEAQHGILPQQLQLTVYDGLPLDKAGLPIPSWDQDLSELTWQGRLVKHLRRAAENQRRIVSAFAEENTRFPLDVALEFGGGEGI